MPRAGIKPLRALAVASAIGLLAALTPAVAAAANTGGAAPAATQAVQITFIKVICPSYSVVPANHNPGNHDATGGHSGELDTSAQTVLTDPSTDIPKSCVKTNGWTFDMFDSHSESSNIGSATTGSDGTGQASVTLSAGEITLAQTSGSPTGLWIAEETQSGATFGALRCGSDIENGDNIENIRNIGSASLHLYCIAYNVAVAQPTPSPTVAPTQAPTTPPTAGTSATIDPCLPAINGAPAAVATATCPFQSFAGETAPTTSASSGTDSGNGSTPLMALLICFGFAGLGLAAVQAQKRSIRR
jgi:hypothetical protein